MSQRRKKQEEVVVGNGESGEGVIDQRMQDKFGTAIRRLFRIRVIKEKDFSRISHKCELRLRSVKSSY